MCHKVPLMILEPQNYIHLFPILAITVFQIQEFASQLHYLALGSIFVEVVPLLFLLVKVQSLIMVISAIVPLFEHFFKNLWGWASFQFEQITMSC